VTSRRRLGWLGPAIAVTGLAVGAIAVWYWRSAQPVPGESIDRIACSSAGERAVFEIRHELGGERAFVELRRGDDLVWQALIPPYAGGRGRPALACGPTAVTVRVERSGRAEVFGFSTTTGDKIGGYRLAPEHEPNHVEPNGPITLTDHVRSYEIVGGPGWHQLIAVDLASGEGLWKTDLGPDPVSDGGVDRARVWLKQGARERSFTPESGRESPVTKSDK
jgi:hypothetical protein